MCITGAHGHQLYSQPTQKVGGYGGSTAATATTTAARTAAASTTGRPGSGAAGAETAAPTSKIPKGVETQAQVKQAANRPRKSRETRPEKTR